MKVAIAGAAGRMGRTLCQIIHEDSVCELAGGLEPRGSEFVGQDMGTLSGLGELNVKITDDPLQLLTQIDGIIDFTIPAATISLAELTAQARIVHVIGTTGLSRDEEARLNAAAHHARIVKSGNMSMGINILAEAVRRVAASLGEEFDIEVLEMHHRHKIDAPSGTALLLGEAAAEGRQLDHDSRSVYTRHGRTGERPVGDIGYATLRGGSVVGEHTVIFSGPNERIELTHKAQSRDIFARGAVAAARWAFDKKPGYYTMVDVLSGDHH